MRHYSIVLLIFILFSVQATAERKVRIYSIGDSTMANKDTTDNHPERGWMMLFGEFIDTSKVEIVNLAKNGRSSRSFRNEGLWEPAYNDMKPGDILFIQFGHNDEKLDTARGTMAHTTFKENLHRYISEAKSKGATPVLFSSIARRKFDNNGKLEDTHGEYVKVIPIIAEETGITYVDLCGATTRVIEETGVEASKSFFMWIQPGVTPKITKPLEDNTHLTTKGARMVSALAARMLLDGKSAVAPYIVLAEKGQ